MSELINTIPLFQGLRHDEVEAFESAMTMRLFPDGHFISQRGTPGRDVFIVISGTCLGVIQSRSGKDVVLDRIGPGRVFGELGALDGGSRVRSVKAAGQVHVGVIAASKFEAWLMRTPDAMRNLLSEVVGNTRELADRYFEMAVHDVETRVRLFLIRLLIEHGELRNGGALDPAPSHSSIAAHVGANREAVSRVISRFSRHGFVESGRRRIVVRDIGALEAGVRAPV